ncbi:MAG: alpha/beta hydrolase [Verrucomicrobiaceae bacterium]|nr:alpha/beta hydrolase [Verrucomicrobiaceae bacterium]
MHSKLYLIAAFWMAQIAALHAETPATTTTKLDVVYKTTEQGPLKIDLHYPAAPKAGARFPLVLFTHGGGWVTGNKTIERGVRLMGLKALNEQGFCVASVDYRLCTNGSGITVHDCVTDAKDALRFLAKNATQFSLDAERVFTWGESAGGHLAQMLLLSPPESFPGDPALADAKYRLIAGVSWYGPSDFEKIELFTPPDGKGVGDRFATRIIQAGADEKAKLAAYREVSPVSYLSSTSPPLLMMQGDKDPTIPVHHAHYMKQRGDAAKAPVEVFIVENSGHNWRELGGTLRPSLDEIMTKTAAFMKQHLDRVSISTTR